MPPRLPCLSLPYRTASPPAQVLQAPARAVFPCPCQTASRQSRHVKRGGQALDTGTRETHLIPRPCTCPRGHQRIAVQFFHLGCFCWQLSGGLGSHSSHQLQWCSIRHLPIILKLTPSQTCPVGNAAVGFLPTHLFILSETHSSLLGFRQRTTDDCFQALGCLT